MARKKCGIGMGRIVVGLFKTTYAAGTAVEVDSIYSLYRLFLSSSPSVIDQTASA